MRLALLLASVTAVVAALSPNVHAQSYPGKPVRVIVAFPPGGSNDIVARIVFQKMTELTGQQHIIDNRGGAAGTIAAAAVAKSAPDGYTLMVNSASHISSGHMRKLPYDTLNDFIGVTPLVEQVFLLVAHPSLPVKSVKDLVALGRSRPGQLLYSSGGNGSALHLAMALFESMTNARMAHVQYKGAAAAVISLISGETQAMMANTGVAAAHIKTGRMRVLGVTSEKRITQFPDIPPISESVPGYKFTAWVGVFLPAGTSGAVVDRLNSGLRTVLADRGIAGQLLAQTFEPMHQSPADFARLLREENERYGKLIRATGATAE